MKRFFLHFFLLFFLNQIAPMSCLNSTENASKSSLFQTIYNQVEQSWQRKYRTAKRTCQKKYTLVHTSIRSYLQVLARFIIHSWLFTYWFKVKTTLPNNFIEELMNQEKTLECVLNCKELYNTSCTEDARTPEEINTKLETAKQKLAKLHADQSVTCSLLQVINFCKAFTAQQKEILQKAQWTPDTKDSVINDIHNRNAPTFFVEKRIISEKTKNYLFSDLHGGIKSLLQALKTLKDEQVFDPTTATLDKNIMLTFMGDFVDKGIYGLLCLLVAYQLKMKNPNQVIITRGNHENPSDIMIKDIRRLEEALEFGTELYYRYYRSNLSLQDKLISFAYPPERLTHTFGETYQALPVMSFVFVKSNDQLYGYVASHAGPDLTYHPQALFTEHTNINLVYDEYQTNDKKNPANKKAIQQLEEENNAKINGAIEKMTDGSILALITPIMAQIHTFRKALTIPSKIKELRNNKQLDERDTASCDTFCTNANNLKQELENMKNGLNKLNELKKTETFSAQEKTMFKEILTKIVFFYPPKIELNIETEAEKKSPLRYLRRFYTWLCNHSNQTYRITTSKDENAIYGILFQYPELFNIFKDIANEDTYYKTTERTSLKFIGCCWQLKQGDKNAYHCMAKAQNTNVELIRSFKIQKALFQDWNKINQNIQILFAPQGHIQTAGIDYCKNNHHADAYNNGHGFGCSWFPEFQNVDDIPSYSAPVCAPSYDSVYGLPNTYEDAQKWNELGLLNKNNTYELFKGQKFAPYTYITFNNNLNQPGFIAIRKPIPVAN